MGTQDFLFNGTTEAGTGAGLDGTVQEFTVPASAKVPGQTYAQVTIECWGAEGGAYNANVTGGLGGYAKFDRICNVGDKFYVRVGGRGGNGVFDSTAGGKGGWNGGGAGPQGGIGYYGLPGGGGGATDVRVGAQALNERIIVAGGGGGSGSENATGGDGGHGGTDPGQDGFNTTAASIQYGGKGGANTGTGSAGGTGGTGADGAAGGVAVGGAGGFSGSTSFNGGGGGGGFYGGGGGEGGTGNEGGAGGGGGSNYGVQDLLVSTRGVRAGHGMARFSWTDAPIFGTDVPTGLTASTGQIGQITTDWADMGTPGTGEGYELQADSVTVYDGKTSGFTHTGLATAVKRAYRVRSYRTETNTAMVRIATQGAYPGTVDFRIVGDTLEGVRQDTRRMGWTIQGYHADGRLLYTNDVFVLEGTLGERLDTLMVQNIERVEICDYQTTTVRGTVYRNTRVNSAWSATVTGTTGVPTPTGLTASAGQVRQVTLDWAGEPGAYVRDDIDPGYELFRDDVLIATLVNSDYLDTGRANGASHVYKVRAFKKLDGSNVYSAFSTTATGTTLALPGATTLSGTAGNKQNSLSWTDTTGEVGYRLYRDGALIYQGADLSRVDPVALNDVTYRYRVAGYNDAGEGALSAEVALTPTFTTVAPVTARVAFAPYLRDVWMRYVLGQTSHVRAGDFGVSVQHSLELNSGVLTNTAPINIGVSTSTKIQGLRQGDVLWETDTSYAFPGGIIPAGELVVYLET